MIFSLPESSISTSIRLNLGGFDASSPSLLSSSSSISVGGCRKEIFGSTEGR